MILAGTDTPMLADGRLARWLFQTPFTVERFQDMLDRRELDPAGIFLSLKNADTIDGVIVTVDLGGAQVDVWPPQAKDDVTAEELLFHAVLHWKARGVSTFQAVIRDKQDVRFGVLERVGFRPVTQLAFYERDLTEADQQLRPLTLQLREADRDELSFAELLLKTFDGSQDVPELNGTRGAAEILAGYQKAAEVDPPLWYFVTLHGEDVGVLILNPESRNVMELTYMGLLPSARGAKRGHELGAIALALASGFGGTVLRLSADVRNTPAHRVYTQLGFTVVERRTVWLLI